MQRCPYCGVEYYRLDITCPSCGAALPLPEDPAPPPPPPSPLEPPPQPPDPPTVEKTQDSSGCGCLFVIGIIIVLLIIVGYKACTRWGAETPKRAGSDNSSPKAPANSDETWKVSVGKSIVTRGDSYVAHVTAKNVTYANGNSEKPELYCECADGRLQTFIYFGAHNDQKPDRTKAHAVTITLDHMVLLKENWTGIATNDRFFEPSPRPMMDQIKVSKELKIEFAPYNSDRETATFNVSGFDEIYPKLLRACPNK